MAQAMVSEMGNAENTDKVITQVPMASHRWSTARNLTLALLTVVLLAACYLSAFYLVRKRFPVTSFEGIPIYYFSRNSSLNRLSWDVFWPIHQSGTMKTPKSTNEWIIEQKNCRAFYIRDIDVVEAVNW